jgi:hypothetical protein
MKSILIFSLLLSLTVSSIAKTIDTIHIKPADLDLKALQTGKYNYIIFNKQTKESPAQRITLVKINVEPQLYHNKSAFIVTQEWDRDTIWHAAYTVFDAKDFSTILHDTYWKSLGYSIKFDFENKTVDFKNHSKEAPDSIKSGIIKDFNQSFEKYNLNWHADLLIYQLLPYKDKRTFVINYYDPGFGKAEDVMYTVTGSDFITDHDGKKIDCWVLNYTDAVDLKVYERFWIAKKTKEVLKEEDFSGRGYRYKIKLGISVDE